MVGWYSTGPKIRSSDLEINERFRKYCKNPVLVIIDVQPKEFGIPTEAYMTIDEIKDVRPAFGWASFCNVRRTDPMACMGQDGTPSSRTFSHLPCSIGALEVSGCVTLTCQTPLSGDSGQPPQTHSALVGPSTGGTPAPARLCFLRAVRGHRCSDRRRRSGWSTCCATSRTRPFPRCRTRCG